MPTTLGASRWHVSAAAVVVAAAVLVGAAAVAGFVVGGPRAGVEDRVGRSGSSSGQVGNPGEDTASIMALTRTAAWSIQSRPQWQWPFLEGRRQARC